MHIYTFTKYIRKINNVFEPYRLCLSNKGTGQLENEKILFKHFFPQELSELHSVLFRLLFRFTVY